LARLSALGQPHFAKTALYAFRSLVLLAAIDKKGSVRTLIVVPPQVAIIGAGRIEPRVLARDGKPAVRRTVPLSLTFDHRAVTGGEAARFLRALKADLERPA
jgi:pyruvate/2-oxoglutarate dehydrogenase complex dihydrolipoamide acyltransferase (E2) component